MSEQILDLNNGRLQLLKYCGKDKAPMIQLNVNQFEYSYCTLNVVDCARLADALNAHVNDCMRLKK